VGMERLGCPAGRRAGEESVGDGVRDHGCSG
jgi:hypothetical protein